jgi:hypothetical protein
MNEEKLIATHEGKITIGENELPCAVLSNGVRVITGTAIFKAFGRTQRGRALHEKENEKRVLNRPSFIDAKNLQPFIDAGLEQKLKVIIYKDKKGK